MADQMTEYQEGKLDIERLKLAAKSRDPLLANAAKALLGDGSVYDQEAELNEKEKIAKVKAVSDYYKALDSGNSAARTRALAHVFETTFTTPERLAKLTSAADPGVMKDVLTGAGASLGDSPADTKQKAAKAWQIFYQQAPRLNGASLMATFDRVTETFGEPQEAYLDGMDGMQGVFRDVQQKVDAQKRLIGNMHSRLREMTDALNSGDEPAAIQGYQEIVRALPSVGNRDAIQNMQQDIEAEPVSAELTRPALIAKRDLALKTLGGETGAEAQPTERNFYAEWLSRPKVQEWAKHHGFDVGYVLPLDDENKKRLAEGKIRDGIVTPNGIYVRGPDDERAKAYGIREMKSGPVRDLMQGLGLGRPGDRKKEFVEFEITGNPKMKQHSDGAWYFETTPEGGKTYLTEDDLAARNASTPEPTVARAGRTADGGSIWILSDGRVAYLGKDAQADNPAIVPQAVADKLLQGAKVMDAQGKVRLPDGIAKDDGLPAGIQRTTTPPMGARETIRLQKDVQLRDAKNVAIAGYDKNGKRVTYTQDQIIGPVRTIAGGEQRYKLDETARALVNRKAFKQGEADLDENQEVAGPAPDKQQIQARKEKVDEIRKGVPTLPVSQLYENFRGRPTPAADIAAQEQRNQASQTAEPVVQIPANTTSLLRGGGAGVKSPDLFTPGSDKDKQPSAYLDVKTRAQKAADQEDDPKEVARRNLRRLQGTPDPAVTSTGTQVETPTR